MSLITLLQSVSDGELEEELRRRKQDKKPPLLPFYNTARLVEVVISGINETWDSGKEPKDFQQHVFEVALETFYGPGIWGPYHKAIKG